MGFRVEDRKAIETSPDEREKNLRISVAAQRVAVSCDERGHAGQQGSERHSRRFHQAHDPRDRAGPQDCSDPVGHRSSLRGRAPPIDTDYFEAYNRPNVSLSLITRFLQCKPGILSCQGRPSSTVTKAGCSTMLC